MAVLAKVHRVTSIAAPWIGTSRNRVKEPEIAAMDPFLYGITPLVAIHAECLVAVARLTLFKVLLRIILMFRDPINLVVFRSQKLFGMTGLRIRSDDKHR